MSSKSPNSGAADGTWPLLHLFYRIEYGAWALLSAEEQIAAKTQMTALVQEIRAETKALLQVLAMFTPKADLGMILSAPDLHAVHAWEKRLTLALGPDVLTPCYSFFSTLETTSSQSAPEVPPEDEVICFFPVNSRHVSTPVSGRPPSEGGALDAVRRGVSGVLGSRAGVEAWVSCSTGLEEACCGVTLFAQTLGGIQRSVRQLREVPGFLCEADLGECYAGTSLPLDALFRRVQL
jgi:peroxiredoxin